MISIVQNFICTQPEIKTNRKEIGKMRSVPRLSFLYKLQYNREL